MKSKMSETLKPGVIATIDFNPVADRLRERDHWGAHFSIVVVAEGARNNADGMARYFQEHQQRLGFELRVTKLGHVQRGGAPGSYDRLLGTLLGAAATEQLAGGAQGMLVGMVRGEVATTPLAEVVAHKKPLDLRLLELAHVLAK